jgi:hypothetical protein
LKEGYMISIRHQQLEFQALKHLEGAHKVQHVRVLIVMEDGLDKREVGDRASGAL